MSFESLCKVDRKDGRLLFSLITSYPLIVVDRYSAACRKFDGTYSVGLWQFSVPPASECRQRVVGLAVSTRWPQLGVSTGRQTGAAARRRLAPSV